MTAKGMTTKNNFYKTNGKIITARANSHCGVIARQEKKLNF
jgi:hypothetical protein